MGTIGIIGAGHSGQAFARVAQRAGRDAVIANSRGPQSLAAVAEALGTGMSPGTVGEAVASAIVVIAVPWPSVPGAVAGLAWDGKLVVDQTNASIFLDMKPADLRGRSSSEITAELGREGVRRALAQLCLRATLASSPTPRPQRRPRRRLVPDGRCDDTVLAL